MGLIRGSYKTTSYNRLYGAPVLMNKNTSNSAKEQLAYGTWPSEISALEVARGTPKIMEPVPHGNMIFWLQSIPEESGRMALFYKSSNSQTLNVNCILPAPFSIRSKVHEYGGKSYCIAEGVLYFVNASDQQIYSATINSPNSDKIHLEDPVALTQTPLTRYAELSYDTANSILFCIGETHASESSESNSHQEPENFIAAIPLKNNKAKAQVFKVASGYDFYAYPAPSHDGKYLAFISWQHPNLPWDNTCLSLLSVDTTKLIASDIKSKIKTMGEIIHIDFEEKVLRQGTACNEESIVQPKWSKTGDLYFISDHNNWWNIYKYSNAAIHAQTLDKKNAKKITNLKAEFATPLWSLGMSCYDFIDEEHILACYTYNGSWNLATINTNTKRMKTLENDFSVFSDIIVNENIVSFLCASPTMPNTVGFIDLKSDFIIKGENKNFITPVKQRTLDSSILHHTNISTGESIRLTSGGNSNDENPKETIHAFFYPPKNKAYEDNNPRNKPPLITICHGGPTGQSDNSLNLKIQFWTNRGFAVVDVNYRGSTGYGRNFRKSLYKNWGVFDIEDVSNIALELANSGKVHSQQKIIKGSSAGGFTVLACLTFTEAFDAGVCLYGIGDLELLANDTHKFEARYLDQLIGPYPENKEIYKQRSPIHHAKNFDCPLLIFQGLEDKVVPPNQAKQMADAIRNKKVPMALVEYSDEGHGFRNPINIEHMMTSELYFYQQIFNLNQNEENNITLSTPKRYIVFLVLV